MGLDEGVEGRLELRAILADRPGDLTVVGDNDVVAHLEVGENLRPDVRLVFVDHRPGQQAGIDHLQNVFVLEVLIHVLQHDRRATGLFEAGTDRRQMLVVAARSTHVQFLPAQIVDAGDRRRRRTGDEHLLRLVEERCGEIDLCKPCLGDRQIGHDDVAKPLFERREQTRPRHWQEPDTDLVDLLLLPLVELVFERRAELDGRAQLLAAIDEVDRLAERHDDAD